ncbi:MAG: cytochrome C [Methylococcaceae bacterium]|nr:cytochrome C [Methylococcaceae bacterium]
MPPNNKFLRHKKSAIALFAVVLLCIFTTTAQALPSFARQTGEACTACHIQTQGSNLTPRGRDFKLKGYTEGEGNGLPPLSMVINGGGVLDLTDRNDNYGNANRDRSFFNGSLFYAGKIFGSVGAYIEGSYALDPDSGSSKGVLNKVDLRFANQVKVAGQQVNYGVSVNNEPGVQDLWNTNAVWNSVIGAPYGAILADRRLSGNVGGATLYAMINDLLYIEAGGYASLPNDVQRAIGRDSYYGSVDGAIPYWRIALQHNWDGHYVSLGHFGLQADLQPSNYYDGVTHESYSDLGVDATYQYLANPEHIFELKGRYVQETRIGTKTASNYYGAYYPSSYKYESTVDTFNVGGTYTWQQTLGLAVGYQQYSSSANANDLELVTTELSYTPFGKQHSLLAPWLNLRLNLGYIADVSKTTYAASNETLYLNGRLAF